MTDLFKAFDCLHHELLIAKLDAYGFNIKPVKLIQQYLSNSKEKERRRVNSVWHGTELVSYLCPKIWDLVPNEIKESESLNGFKFKIKRWVPEGCPCRICKIYLGQVGFIIT